MGKTGRKRTKVTPEYLAGFFDGEGCVAVSLVQARLEINHTYYDILDNIHNEFGGVLCGPYQRHNWKINWRWQISGEPARKAALAMLPYLREKREQIEYYLEWLDALPMGNLRQELADKCRKAKRHTHDEDSPD